MLQHRTLQNLDQHIYSVDDATFSLDMRPYPTNAGATGLQYYLRYYHTSLMLENTIFFTDALSETHPQTLK